MLKALLDKLAASDSVSFISNARNTGMLFRWCTCIYTCKSSNSYKWIKVCIYMYLVLFIKLQKESSLALRFKFYLAIKLKLTSTYNSHKPKFGLQSYTNLTNKIFHCSLNTKQQIELIQTSPFLSVRRLHIEN